MGLLDSVVGATSGKTDAPGGANPLVGILGGLSRKADYKDWRTRFHRAAAAAPLIHGSAWVRTNLFLAIKFKMFGAGSGSCTGDKDGIDAPQASALLAEFLVN